MKLLSLAIFLSTITKTLSKKCCKKDNDAPNISNRDPVAWTVHPANKPITFKAYMDDLCGLSKIYINLYGYAMRGYKKSKTPASNCPPGHFCIDYSFPRSGQNW